MEYLIRDFQESDLKQLIELCSRHAAYEKAVYNAEGKEILLRNALLSAKPNLYCWIVMVGDEVAGYVTYTFDFSTWDAGHFLHLDCLYLEKKFRGFGIGSAIITKLKDVARKKNCINLQWQTPVFNESAIRFYVRSGGIGTDKKRFVLWLERHQQ